MESNDAIVEFSAASPMIVDTNDNTLLLLGALNAREANEEIDVINTVTVTTTTVTVPPTVGNNQQLSTHADVCQQPSTRADACQHVPASAGTSRHLPSSSTGLVARNTITVPTGGVEAGTSALKAQAKRGKRREKKTSNLYVVTMDDSPPCRDDYNDYIICRQWRFTKQRFLSAAAVKKRGKNPTVIKRIAVVKCKRSTSRFDYALMFGKWHLVEMDRDAHYRLQSGPRTLINVLHFPQIRDFYMSLDTNKAWQHTSGYAVRHVQGDIEHWINWSWNAHTRMFVVGQFKNATYGVYRMRWSTLRFICKELWCEIKMFLPSRPSNRHLVRQRGEDTDDSDYDIECGVDDEDEDDGESHNEESNEEEGNYEVFELMDADFQVEGDAEVDIWGDDSDSDLPGTPVYLDTPPPASDEDDDNTTPCSPQ